MTTNPNKPSPGTFGLTLGIDIGGTKIKSCVFSDPNSILCEYVTHSRAGSGPNAVHSALREVIDHFHSKEFKFTLVGIGCAGSVDTKSGVVRNSPNFKNWTDISLSKWVSEDTECPTFVDNDANCALISEAALGKARGKLNVVLLTLGTGIGGAILIDGKIYRGSTGTAGELGHLSIHSRGISCPCGNTGCFERYCSASALKLQFPGVSSKDIFSKASEEPRFQTAVTEFMTDLKIGLTSIANAFDPDLILLGGAVSGGVGPYLNEIRSWLKQHAFPAIGKNVTLELTDFSNMSGALGAGLMARNEWLSH